MYAYTAVTLISEVEHLDAFIKHNQGEVKFICLV